MAARDCKAPVSSRWTTVGATSNPTTPPPRNPTKASTPTTKPWRYPLNAKEIAEMTRTRSIQFTRGSPSRSGHFRWQLFEPIAVPRLFPTGQPQQPVQQPGGEAPYEQPRHPERGADVTARMGDLHPVRGVQ